MPKIIEDSVRGPLNKRKSYFFSVLFTFHVFESVAGGTSGVSALKSTFF